MVQGPQALDQLIIGITVRPGPDDALRGVEHIRWNDGFECAFFLDPHVGRVFDAQLLELERNPVVDVVADVLLVRQHLVHRSAGPLAVEVSTHRHTIQACGDLGLDQAVINEPAVHEIDGADFIFWPGHENDAVGLQAFVLTPSQLSFDGAVLVNEHTAQSIPSRSTLAVAELNQSALPGEHLGGQFPAVLTGHGPFDALDNGGHRGAVILKLLGTVGDLNAGTSAPVLVVRAFVRVLEPTPPADVIDQNDRKVR